MLAVGQKRWARRVTDTGATETIDATELAAGDVIELEVGT